MSGNGVLNTIFTAAANPVASKTIKNHKQDSASEPQVFKKTFKDVHEETNAKESRAPAKKSVEKTLAEKPNRPAKENASRTQDTEKKRDDKPVEKDVAAKDSDAPESVGKQTSEQNASLEKTATKKLTHKSLSSSEDEESPQLTSVVDMPAVDATPINLSLALPVVKLDDEKADGADVELASVEGHDEDQELNSVLEPANAPILQGANPQTADLNASPNSIAAATDSALMQSSAGVVLSAQSLPKSVVQPTSEKLLPDATGRDVLSVGEDISKKMTDTNSPRTDEKNTLLTDTAEQQATHPQGDNVKTTFEKILQTAMPQTPAPDVRAPVVDSTQTNIVSNLLGVVGADTSAPAGRSFVVQTAVPVPVGQPQWSEAVGERVLWLAAQNISSAEISLHPKDLGPVQVQVSVNQDQASISFSSSHAQVREVLDQGLNRLRDMFAEQGLNLVNVDVSDKSFQRQQAGDQQAKGKSGNGDAAVDEEVPVAVSHIMQKRLVDHYA